MLPRSKGIHNVHRIANQTRSIFGLTKQVYEFSKKMLPKISPTERAALNAGTVGFDRKLFAGTPTLADLEQYKVWLTTEESNFLEHEVNALCEIVDDYKISQVTHSPYALDY